jgi:DNA-binding MarR family transcriptional regulator
MDRRILLMLNHAQHRMEKRANRELKEIAGITLVQGGALAFLLKNDGCLLKEISAGLRLNNSAITGLVERKVFKFINPAII